MSTPTPTNAARAAFAWIVSGAVLIVLFFSLSVTRQGLGVSFAGPLGFEATKELNFWLGCILFLFPGCCLVLWAFRKQLGGWIHTTREKLSQLDRREQKLMVILFFAMAFIVARIGHWLVLKEFPITDDELGAQLGGQVMATGRLMAEMWQPFSAYMHPFMFVKDGHYTSFELPGTLAAWAAGDIINNPALIWALLAAIPVASILLIARKFVSIPLQFLAGAAFLFAPQALALSMTTHSHILARAWLSLALLSYVYVYDRESDRHNVNLNACLSFGLVTGMGLLSRPYEFAMVLLPFWTSLAFDFGRPKNFNAKAIGACLLGLLGPLALFALYNLATTGDVLKITRNRPAYYDIEFPDYTTLEKRVSRGDSMTMMRFWMRIGSNVANNLMGVALWFYAPIGLLLAIYGAFENRFSRLLGWGLLSCFVLSLFHDNYGIHSVGPINFSVTPVLLALLVTFGVKRLLGVFSANSGKFSSFYPVLQTSLAAAFVSALVFFAVNARDLNRQAGLHEFIYSFVDMKIDQAVGADSNIRTVVLADRYVSYWGRFPGVQDVGSYVYEWRVPHPALDERVIFLRDDPATLAQLREKFPKRRFFRLKSIDTFPFLEVTQLKFDGGN